MAYKDPAGLIAGTVIMHVFSTTAVGLRLCPRVVKARQKQTRLDGQRVARYFCFHHWTRAFHLGNLCQVLWS